MAGAAVLRDDPVTLLRGLVLTAAAVVLAPLQPPAVRRAPADA